MRRSWLLALVLPLVASIGCATNLANLKTAETLKKGQWRPSAEFGVFIPAGTIAKAGSIAVEQGRSLVEAARTGASAAPTQEEQREIFTTALALAVFPPGTVMNLQLRYGITNDIDVGLRYASTSYRADGRFRLFKHENEQTQSSTHLALVVGIEKHNFSGLLFDMYEKLQKLFELFRFIELENPSRWDADLALIVSWNFKQIVRPYLGLTYRIGRYSMPAVLSLQYEDGSLPLIAEADVKDWLHFIGTTGGVAVGYKWVYFFAELDIAYLFSKPKILGQPTAFGGLTFFPAAGLALRIP
ncbi:MAG: hypothetical protein P1V51_22145 [Deltaproteobacteria bacterium]|nr:hypothetical protein [Deltaproteobacteria bacterium]